MPTPEQQRFILQSGILAPSADNHHYLRFETTSNGLKIWHSEPEWPQNGGYKWAALILSFGAVAENLAIAASRFGFHAEVELFPDPAAPALAFQVRWQARRVSPDPLADEIPRRHCNRRVAFRGPPLVPTVLRRLSEEVAAAYTGCNLTWLDNRERKMQAVRLLRLAEEERFRTRALHSDLFAAIRFDVGWNRGAETGLSPGSLGIERPLRPIFAWLRHWPVMRGFNLLGGSSLLGWRAATFPCLMAPHLGAIVVDGLDDAHLFEAGRAFQRVWLVLTQCGLVLQPMAVGALFAFPGATADGVPKGLQGRLIEGWDNVFPAGRPVMLFRAGRARPLSVAASRSPLENYMVDLG